MRINLKQIKLLSFRLWTLADLICRHHRRHSHHSFWVLIHAMELPRNMSILRAMQEALWNWDWWVDAENTASWTIHSTKSQLFMPAPYQLQHFAAQHPPQDAECMWQDAGMARAPHRGRANPKPSGCSAWDWKTMNRRSNQMMKQTIKWK